MPERQQNVPRRTISSKQMEHSHTASHLPENQARPGVDTNVKKPYRGKGF